MIEKLIAELEEVNITIVALQQDHDKLKSLCRELIEIKRDGSDRVTQRAAILKQIEDILK